MQVMHSSEKLVKSQNIERIEGKKTEHTIIVVSRKQKSVLARK